MRVVFLQSLIRKQAEAATLHALHGKRTIFCVGGLINLARAAIFTVNRRRAVVFQSLFWVYLWASRIKSAGGLSKLKACYCVSFSGRAVLVEHAVFAVYANAYKIDA